MSFIENEINAFLAKKSKASIVLEMLLNREFITCSDIILYGYKPEFPTVFTTNPQGLIESIRKHFGYDFVQDEDIKFFRTMYRNGKLYRMSDTYKKYFLKKLEGINAA